MASLNIVILGDSVTWGRGLSSRVGWANLLRNEYENKIFPKASLYDLGIDGDTSRDILQRFDIEAKARSPHIIIFAVGVNDSCYIEDETQPLVSEKKYAENMTNLINKAKKLTGSRVLCVSPVKGSNKSTCPFPDSKTGKCYTKKRVKLYTDILESVCKNNYAVFVNLYKKLNDSDFYDGLHPSASGHQKIYTEVSAHLQDIFKTAAI